jgi:hypothetical protein
MPYVVTTKRPYVRRPYGKADEFLKPVSRRAVATLEEARHTVSKAMPELPMNFTKWTAKCGQRVQLRFTGSRHVPQRLAEAWAWVYYTPAKSRGSTFEVEVYSEPGATRRITPDHIYVVEHDGYVIARRVQTASGTRLAQVLRFDLPESGGTVGPLPDGTVIEVEPIPGFVLAKFAELSAQDALACSLLQDWTPAIAAFNAREASHA